MPLYDYQCPACGTFSAWGSIKEPYADAACPSCAQPGARVIVAPRLSLMPSNQRQAHERNERSAHEPAHRSRPACGCSGTHTCAGASKAGGSARDSAAGAPRQSGAGRRPWMLGH